MSILRRRIAYLLFSMLLANSRVAADDQGQSHEASSTELRERRQLFHARGFDGRGRPFQRRGFSHFQLPGGRPRSYSVSSPHSPSSAINNRFSVFAAKPQSNLHFSHTNNINKHPPTPTVFPGQLTHFQVSEHKGPFKFPVKGPATSFTSSSRPAPPFRPAITSLGHDPQHRFSPAPPVIHQPLPGPIHVFGPIGRQCGQIEECVPVVVCAPFYPHLSVKPGVECILYEGAKGVCCPLIPSQLGFSRRIFPGPAINVPLRVINIEAINEAAEEGLLELGELDEFESILQTNNIVVNEPGRPAFGHLLFFKTNPAATAIGRNALTNVFTSSALARRFQLNDREAGFGLASLNLRNSVIDNTCPQPPTCQKKDNYYRTIDGTCNNFRNPSQGRARSPFSRILPPQYENGIESARMNSRVGVKLPSARVVSISNVVDDDRPNLRLSLTVMQWGQFIDHDITQTPIRQFGANSGIECCNKQGQFVGKTSNHPACLPIEIPADDPFYKRFGRRCMNFVRSQIATKVNCSLGYEEQMNQLTHYLDGSAVYGSSDDEERAIRDFQGGRLKTQRGDLLPADRNASKDECDVSGRNNVHCFLAGDNRVNEQPDLAAVHTIWLREHNRLATKLSEINPYWNDETIYQEARRIVVAQIQHITYNEFLPVVLGPDYAQDTGLLPLREGFSDVYDESVDASILNEFATVAFRFGHTLVQGQRHLFDKYDRHSGTLKLHEHFNSPNLLYQPGKLDEFLRGLLKQPMQSFDNFVSMALQHRLFQGKSQQFGMDLVALNIQRGRDHAVATYNDLRGACGYPRARQFDDFDDDISSETLRTFKLLYPTVDDIDPFIAGISEEPVSGGVVGPLFRCIIGEQFQRLRRGDRFFYDNAGQAASFTEAQLAEIRETSWARLLCDNGMHIKHVQPLAFRLPGPLNDKTDCSSPSIPSLDLTYWISEKPYH